VKGMREKALVVESDHFAKFLLLVRCQPFLEITCHVLKDVRLFPDRGV